MEHDSKGDGMRRIVCYTTGKHRRRHLALLAVAMLLAITGCGGEGGGEPITAQKLLGRMDAGDPPFLLDVRATGEFKAVHIAGARNIPHYQLRDRLTELPDPAEEIVVIDQKGGRARAARNVLSDAGYSNVRILEGHMFQWVMNRYPLAN